MDDYIMVTLIGILGLMIGSFLNVVIYRLPHNESVVFPRSHCPCCQHLLSAGELIPVVSYLVQRGKCRHCGCSISPRYVFVEILTGLLFVVMTFIFGLTVELLIAWFLLCWFIAVIVIDIEQRLIPDQLNAAGAIVGIVVTFWHVPWYDGFLGLLLGGGLLLIIALVSRGGMGGGDIKFMAAVGLFLGWEMTLVALLLAFIAGGVGSLILLAFKLKGRKDAIPFGPYLALACWCSYLWGHEIVNWYWKLFC